MKHLLKKLWLMIRYCKCPNCGEYAVSHSHTEYTEIKNTSIEVYKCKECKYLFV